MLFGSKPKMEIIFMFIFHVKQRIMIISFNVSSQRALGVATTPPSVISPLDCSIITTKGTLMNTGMLLKILINIFE